MTKVCCLPKLRRLCAIAIALTCLCAIGAAGAFASGGATITAANWSGLSWGAPSAASPFVGFRPGTQVRRSGGAFIAARGGKPISAAAAFSAPSAKRCLSGRRLTIRLRRVPHVRWVALSIKVNGRHLETVKRSRLSRPVKLTGLPTGRFVVSITARAADGRTVTLTRTYRPCATKQPPAAEQTLTVALAGSGTGSVSGGGIVCPTACSHKFTSGTTVKLTASPESGSSFGGWSGAGCAGLGTCTVTMNAAKSLTATFTANPPPTHTLTVALAGSGSGRVSGGGLSCPSTCSKSFASGTAVTLTASPATGSSFSGWSGACTGTGACAVTMNSDQSVTATFASGSQSPGSYSGSTHQGYALSFYVAADGTQMQDVSIPTVGIGCTPTNSFADQLNVASIPIGAEGSFTSTTTQTGVLSGAPATFTYTFSGNFAGTTATGVFREDIAFNNGTAYSCTSNVQSWSVTRDTQGSQAASAPPPGSYSGSTHQGYGLSFYVAADSKQMQDVSIPTVGIGCTPTSSFADQLNVASIPIGADGSFTSTTTQTGVLSGAPATFTYTFNGHFHGTTSSGDERVGGQLREDIAFNNGTAYSCTSNVQSWSVTRDTQGSQAASAPPPGSYSGSTHQGYGLSFYVAADSKQMQDVSIPTVGIGCTPTSSFADQLNVASIPIGADGSFTSTTTQTGVLSGAPATFTYTFNGHFHGTTSSGDERVGGQLREDIAFNNGTAYSCTSNVQSWSVTRDTQGSQAASAPPPGSYSGSTHQGYALSFNVAADSTQLQNVSIPTVGIGCAPTNSFAHQLNVASIPIGADGSFTSTTTQTGVLSGAPATFTYTFNGHFHGTTSSGHERVGGQLREDITFNNGTAYSCTSNEQSWSATH